MIDIGPLCARCTALCCRYITVELKRPVDEADFDEIRWFVLHEGVSVYLDDNTWYLQVLTRCRHLEADNRCGIYRDRPEICRQHGADGACELTGETGAKVLFETAAAFDHWREGHRGCA